MSDGPYTVLVVEDEPWVRLALAERLEDCGFAVLEAASARAAIDVLEHPPRVDLVLTDPRLPGEGEGIALARWIAANRPDVPVMLTSGEPGPMASLQVLCRAEGLSSFGKSHAQGEVGAQILELIRKRKGAGDSNVPP